MIKVQLKDGTPAFIVGNYMTASCGNLYLDVLIAKEENGEIVFSTIGDVADLKIIDENVKSELLTAKENLKKN